jgi:AraC-like DNA-binding protein
VNDAAATSALASYRTFAEGLPQGGRIERHVHEQDQLAVWRRHSRLLTSLTLLAEGKSIATAAHAVGYDSTSAFGRETCQNLTRRVQPQRYSRQTSRL